ncbi:MAG: choice-of-anchor B family protein [Gemmatimonadales bacterium]
MGRFLTATLGFAMLAAPAAAQQYGSAVAAGARDILIGEPINQYSPGLVHVYRRGASGAWQHAAQFQARGGTALDRFGRSLSLAGDRVLVGATSIDSSKGAGYVFERDRAGTWTERAKLVPASAENGDSWGRQVLLTADAAYVAAWGAKGGRGAISVWQPDGGRWVERGVVTAANGAENDFFGSSFSVAGDLMVVGAAQRDTAKGGVYLFQRDGAGAWKEAGQLPAEGLARFARFGAAVLIDGDAILVGAPGLDGGMGAVLVYRRQGDGWAQTNRFGPFDGAQRAGFGSVIQKVDREIWIGAPGADSRGRVYRLAQGTDGTLSGVTKLGRDDTDAGDQFGSAFAVAGTVAVVGMPGDDFGAGTAAILSRGTSGWTGGPKVFTEEKTLAALTGSKRECGTAKEVGGFGCDGVDLMAFLPIPAIGGGRGVRLNDVWGWTDPQSGREYALVGRIDGTAFVDITDPSAPQYLGDLPKTEGVPAGAWRDIKVYKDHAFIVADGSGNHGMQVFDLTHLRGVRAARHFAPDVWYDKLASAHNIVIDTTSGYAFAVGVNGGGETCGGALHMIDIREPKQPRFAGCFADPSTGNQRTGYTHDAQCVVYQGPDEAHRGRQICLNASENAIGIADVTDKANPKALSRAAYPDVGYTHQGWLSEDQRFFYVNDEGDEVQGLVQGTRTLIWDVSDLDDPVLAGQYISENKASDHNLYVKGNLMYQSNYSAGLRILDISDPKNPKPVGFFDTDPVGADAPGFEGSWSNYPYFKSGTLVVTSIQEGLFLVRKQERALIP